MVIFGKKAKALLKRVEDLEMSKTETSKFIELLNNEIKELALTVENGLENGEPRKTPQQLLKEWFTGDDKEDDR